MKIVYTLAFWLVEVDLDSDEVSHGFHRLSFCIRHGALGIVVRPKGPYTNPFKIRFGGSSTLLKASVTR